MVSSFRCSGSLDPLYLPVASGSGFGKTCFLGVMAYTKTTLVGIISGEIAVIFSNAYIGCLQPCGWETSVTPHGTTLGRADAKEMSPRRRLDLLVEFPNKDTDRRGRNVVGPLSELKLPVGI